MKKDPKRNVYAPHECHWTLEDWTSYCPPMEYRVKHPDDLPDFLPDSLLKNFNCAMVASSGNEQNWSFIVQGYRIDKGEIDEHQFIATFDLTSEQAWSGFVHHADYPGRTTEIPSDMLTSLSLSGITTEAHFSRKPPEVSGSITDLIEAGIIEGFTNSISTQEKSIEEEGAKSHEVVVAHQPGPNKTDAGNGS